MVTTTIKQIKDAVSEIADLAKHDPEVAQLVGHATMVVPFAADIEASQFAAALAKQLQLRLSALPFLAAPHDANMLAIFAHIATDVDAEVSATLERYLLAPDVDAAGAWLATPVHLEARLDHVRLDDRGDLGRAAVRRPGHQRRDGRGHRLRRSAAFSPFHRPRARACHSTDRALSNP